MANTLAFLCDSSANRCQWEEGLQSVATGTEPWITMEPVQGWSDEGFFLCFLLFCCVMNAFADHFHTRVISAALPSLTFTHMLSRKKLPSSLSCPAQFLIPLFIRSHFLILILLPSFSRSVFFALDPVLSRAWLAAAPWRLPSGGPFVGTAFGWN